MGHIWLITGPPGCGKTNWILNTLQNHSGPKAYLQLHGHSSNELEQAGNVGIDRAWLTDQIPDLQHAEVNADLVQEPQKDQLTLIEWPQFHPPKTVGIEGADPSLLNTLSGMNLSPQRVLNFGCDAELPDQDTLRFTRLESWSLNLHGQVWDPNSLSSFWFELVNGAYGDVYRAKALMNLPDGRAFLCNWMVSQPSSQFLPLKNVLPPLGRPQRTSELVVQGKALNSPGIESTIHDCLLSDEALELHQAPLREQFNQQQSTPSLV